MNKICQEYISEVKSFFPLVGKEERKYLKKLKCDVVDFCIENNITTKDELYKSYGLPNEVVNNYYAEADTEYIIKRLRAVKLIKILISVLVISMLLATSTFSICFIKDHIMYARETEVINIEEVIK